VSFQKREILFQIIDDTFETKCRFFQRITGIILEKQTNKQTNKKEQDKNLQLKLLGDLNFGLFLC